jgi:nucleoside-diphosphate-sugar epimerase
MRVLLAGGSGTVGRRLLPLLLQAGHQVTGTARSEAGAARIAALGAEPVVMDATEEAQVDAVMRRARPDAIIHQLTSLADGSVEGNARLRTVGTANLVAAAQAYGVSRIVVQSIAWAYAPGPGPATEDDALDLGAAAPRSVTVGGIRSLESSAARLDEHVVLRYGVLYGPGTWYAPGGLVSRRIAEGTLTATPAVTSFLHVDDAAAAAVLALDWPSCTVNIVDDDPAPGTTWVPAIARELGLPSPAVQSKSAQWERGASNTRARTTLDWEPRFPSWTHGFTT